MSERPSGNMQSTIEHTGKEQVRRRNLLAMYPDISEVGGEYHARSARTTATNILSEEGVLVAYAAVFDDGTRLAQPHEMTLHVRAGGLPISDAIQALRAKHPESYDHLLAIVAEGYVFSGNDDTPY